MNGWEILLCGVVGGMLGEVLVTSIVRWRKTTKQAGACELTPAERMNRAYKVYVVLCRAYLAVGVGAFVYAGVVEFSEHLILAICCFGFACVGLIDLLHGLITRNRPNPKKDSLLHIVFYLLLLGYFALLLVGTQYDVVFVVFAVAVLLLIAARVAGLAVRSQAIKL